MKAFRHINHSVNKLLLSLTLLIISFLAKAQEELPDIDIDVEKESAWYQGWWPWAVGLAIFIIIIVAITNRGGKRD